MGYKKGEILKTAFEQYQILGQIGAGGAGEVYEAEDVDDGARVAVKTIRPQLATSSRLKRFKNEIHFCAKDNHPNLIRVLGSGIAGDGSTFYVMPLYPATLRQEIDKGIDFARVLPLLGKILDGIEAAHLLQVWHRDIKPENILIDSNAEQIVLADFGIADFSKEDLLTAVETNNQERLANFQYSAPEQKRKTSNVDGKADIFALGLILNELFTGEVPHGTGFRKIADVSPDHAYLDAIVEKMLQQDPGQRPTVREVKSDLIARGNEFLSLQRLNALKREVIPESELDDPIASSPITIQSVDYRDGRLHLGLSCAPPPNWIAAFQSGGYTHSYSLGAGPAYFVFNGEDANVPIPSAANPQNILDNAKEYVRQANRLYLEDRMRQHRKRIEVEKERHRRAIEEEDRRRKILADLKL